MSHFCGLVPDKARLNKCFVEAQYQINLYRHWVNNVDKIDFLVKGEKKCLNVQFPNEVKHFHKCQQH